MSLKLVHGDAVVSPLRMRQGLGPVHPGVMRGFLGAPAHTPCPDALVKAVFAHCKENVSHENPSSENLVRPGWGCLHAAGERLRQYAVCAGGIRPLRQLFPVPELCVYQPLGHRPQQLKAATQRQLEARGLQLVASAPQLLVNFNASIADGRGVLERLLVHRRAAGWHQCHHHFGLLPQLQAARAQTRRRRNSQSRAAPELAGRGVAA